MSIFVRNLSIVLGVSALLASCSRRENSENAVVKATCIPGLPCTPPPGSTVFTPLSDPTFLPRDPEFANQSSFNGYTGGDTLAVSPDRTGILAMWRFNPRTPSGYDFNSTTSLVPEVGVRSSLSNPDVKIAILDTGRQPRGLSIPDIDPKVVDEYDFITDTRFDGDGPDGDASAVLYNASGFRYECPPDVGEPGTSILEDHDYSHGISMASVAAAAINKQDVVGAAPGASLMMYRVMQGGVCDEDMLYGAIPNSFLNQFTSVTEKAMWTNRLYKGRARWQGVIDAINRAADRGASVINMSFGVPIDYPLATDPKTTDIVANACSKMPRLQEAIDNAVAKGVVVVVSAPNNLTSDIDNDVPSSCNNIIIAHAVSSRGEMIPTSQSYFATSRVISHYAPTFGVDSNDTRRLDISASTPIRTFVTNGKGSSTAAAILSGVIANMRSIDPTLTPEMVRNLLWNTSRLPKVANGCTTKIIDGVTGAEIPNSRRYTFCADRILDAKGLIDKNSAGIPNIFDDIKRNNYISRHY